jgi:hypothetical protein
VPDAVLSRATFLTSSSKATHSLARADGSFYLRAVGNLGAVWPFSYTQQSSMTADGLTYDVTSLVGQNPRHGSGTTRSLTVCGLVTLLSESAAGGVSGDLMFLPTGKSVTALPVGASPGGMTERFRVHSLESDSDAVCNPVLGKPFVIKVSAQRERLIPAPLQPFRVVNTFDEITTCTPEALHSELSFLAKLGATLLVKCTHQSISRRPIASHFVYIPRAGRYLPIYIQHASSTDDRIEYSNLRFAPG